LSAEDHVVETFNRYFAEYGVSLPAPAFGVGERGVVEGQGWRVQFLFAEDERGLYLDFYSRHRMYGDAHIRIRAYGAMEELPSYEDAYSYPFGSSREVIEAAEQAYVKRMQSVGEMLRRKGFDE
jgi:hypothetical protein